MYIKNIKNMKFNSQIFKIKKKKMIYEKFDQRETLFVKM